jgi:uncharacterized membrane protein
MTDMGKGKSLMGRFFKRGLRALLPTVLTLAVLIIAYKFFAENIVDPINRGIRVLLTDTSPGNAVLDSIFSIDVEAETYRKDPARPPDRDNIQWDRVRKDIERVYPGWLEALVGFIVALVLVFLAGFVLATFIGRRILGRFENLMARFPIVKVVYPYARQIVEFLMREKAVQFNSVVAVEYPRKGVYSVGFVTGNGLRALNRHAKGQMVTVFIPSAPTPVTGWAFFIPVDEVIPLPLTVDQAVRFCISCGVLLPDGQQNPDDVLSRFKDIEAPTISQEFVLPPELRGIGIEDDEAGSPPEADGPEG